MLWVLFGFMNVMIIWKWLMPWNFDGNYGDNRFDNSLAPNIITVLINMFLKGGSIEKGATYIVISDDAQ